MATPDRYRVHRWIDRAVLVGLPALGLAHPTPIRWYESFGGLFAFLAVGVMLMAWIVTLLAERKTARIQGPRRAPPMIREEAFITLQAMWVMASLAAWPLTAHRLGFPTGFTWSLEGTGWTPITAIAVTAIGLVGVDAWTYWKHRALHTKWLFGFHRDHHRFRDPTAFAGFAVGPVEALWTFLPVLAVWHPLALHWGPLYFGLILAFVLLNLYLHCGIEVTLLERLIPPTGINTSAFHNVHHSHVRANFGEVATWWDRVCKTRSTDLGIGPAPE
jgi:sterol desaturase/sphingolipid hydroxylase (fatty acid hydroxylase superfamily)